MSADADLRAGINAPMTALAVGAVGSLALLVNAARTTPKPLLLLMAVWVVSPFVALFAGNAMAKRWSASIRATLRATMVVVALGSLAVYTFDTVKHIAGKPAAVYVMVPPISWLLIGIAAAAAFASERRSRRRAEA